MLINTTCDTIFFNINFMVNYESDIFIIFVILFVFKHSLGRTLEKEIKNKIVQQKINLAIIDCQRLYIYHCQINCLV